MDTSRLRRRHWLLLAGLVLGLALVLSACGTVRGVLGGKDEGNPIPTPLPSEDVGAQAQSAAQDTPEGTWENYVRDIIAEQVKRQEAKVNLYERYQDPSITVQNTGGLVGDIDLVEDRTAFNISGGTLASSNTDFDVRITFANGDTDTRTCRFTVSMEFDEEAGVWYVVNPEPLAVFAVCG
jgi:hypothetical protein